MVYLDYAATCPVVKYPQLLYTKLYCDTAGRECFLNPNANYAYKEKRLLSEAENRVKKVIGAKGGKVIFGGTSSQLIENLMSAVSYERLGYEIVCSHYDHDSFYKYRDRDVFNLNDLKFELDTADDDVKSIVIWQAVQNLTGEIFPTKQIGELVRQYHGFYICDGTAQIGHTPIEPNIDDWCDFYVFSGHKLGTELGIGCCWISDRFDKWLDGFKLHGTPNLAGALAMTQAVEDACDSRTIEKNNAHWVRLANKFGGLLNKNNIKHTFVPFVLDDYTCAINTIRLFGFNADALQQFLASKQVYISIGGSACAEKHDYRVLNAYGLNNDEASEVIRVSFGEDSSVEDVEALVEGIVAFRKEYL